MKQRELDMDERRKLLREALRSTDINDVAPFASALAGAGEEDRVALSRTLPAAKLLRAEGPTPRACFVLAALAKPAVVVAEIFQPRSDTVTYAQDTDQEDPPRCAEPLIEEFLLAAAHDRDWAWHIAFIDALSGSWPGLHAKTWPLARALIDD